MSEVMQTTINSYVWGILDLSSSFKGQCTRLSNWIGFLINYIHSDLSASKRCFLNIDSVFFTTELQIRESKKKQKKQSQMLAVTVNINTNPLTH